MNTDILGQDRMPERVVAKFQSENNRKNLQDYPIQYVVF